MEKLNVSVGSERVIYSGCSREPSLFRLASGELKLTFHAVPDVHFAHRACYASRDGGRTWQPEAQRSHREQALGELGGRVWASDIYTFERQPGEFTGSYFTSEDGGETFSGPRESIVRINRVAAWTYPTAEHTPEPGHPMAKFFIPMPEYYEPIAAAASRRMGFSFWRYPVETDGRWIAPMQGKFYGDRCYRTVLVESHDQGASWDYVSTIANPLNEERDGFCEPVLMRVADGSLLCMLRRGSSWPLAQVRSLDGGKTWSQPEFLSAHGVDPDLCVLPNGVLACSYGRPGRHLMFSVDGCGYSWGYATDLGSRSGSTYMGLAATGDDTLLVTYDEIDPKIPQGIDKIDASGGYNPDYFRHAYIGAREVKVSRSRL